MIRINLDDPRFEENVEALLTLRRMGLHTDAELQEMYDRQLEQDAAEAARDIKCPCGMRDHMDDEACNAADCDDCCPLAGGDAE